MLTVVWCFCWFADFVLLNVRINFSSVHQIFTLKEELDIFHTPVFVKVETVSGIYFYPLFKKEEHQLLVSFRKFISRKHNWNPLGFEIRAEKFSLYYTAVINPAWSWLMLEAKQVWPGWKLSGRLWGTPGVHNMWKVFTEDILWSLFLSVWRFLHTGYKTAAASSPSLTNSPWCSLRVGASLSVDGSTGHDWTLG